MVKGPVELLDWYILYDDAPLTVLQLIAITDVDCAVALTPVGVARMVIPLTAPDCAPSVPPLVTALTA
jgi:hypothetical protein